MARGSGQGDGARRALTPTGLPAPETRRHGLRFAVLSLAGLFAVRTPLPWMGAALVFAVAADVEGVLTARALAREGLGRVWITWCLCGVALVSLMGLGVLGTLALYPASHSRQECLQGANTYIARAACGQEFDRRVHDLHLPGG